MRALIADDDRISAKMLEAALTQWGFSVTTVHDGAAAWQTLAGADEATLAILDWMMPGLHGPEICRRVRTDTSLPPIYVLLLTARSARSDIVEGLDAGADDYLVKPFDPDELRARVHVGKRMLDTLTRVIQLSGLLPICSYCKRIRTDQNYWEQVEQYLAQRSNAVFSHGICPVCYEKAMAEAKA
jgi:phosphoserine phosphatase RsbU/P